MPDQVHARAPRWAFVATGLALAGLVAVAVISFLDFNHETDLASAYWVSGQAKLSNGILVAARALKVDTSVNQITFRVSYQPEGSYADPSGRLTRPVEVALLTDTGSVTRKFAAGQEMQAQEVSEDLFDGFQANYPFDHYNTDLSALITTGSGALAPSTLAVEAPVHGFAFSLSKDSIEPDGSRRIALAMDRSAATRLFAIFVMIILWALAAVAVGLMARVLLLGRRIEFGMFAFLAAMLFAFPAVRNALPGAPPLGVRSDYLSFFWCEMLVAFSLIAMLATWVIRHAATDP